MECNLGWNHTRDFIHFEIAQVQNLVSSMQYWASLRLNSSIFLGEKIRVLETKVAKFASWYLLSLIFLQFNRLFSVNLEIWLVVLFLVKPPYWLGKICELKQKMVRVKNKSHQLEPIRLQGPTVISKWV